MIDLGNKEKYSKRVGSLSSNCSVLTASTLDDINQVFYADGPSSPVSSPIDLSIRYVTADQYHDLVTGQAADGEFEAKTLYIVSSDEINAYNSPIKNVGDPIDSTDAVNLRSLVSNIQGSSRLRYHETEKMIVLSSGNVTTSVDCNPFLSIDTSEIENNISTVSSWLGRNFDSFTNDADVNELKIKKLFGLSANAATIGSRLSSIPITGTGSFVNGDKCVAISSYSHAEGSNSFSLGTAAHAEGGGTTASNLVAHAEGAYTTASGIAAHSEGLGLLSSDEIDAYISQIEMADPQTAAYLRALIADGLGAAKAPVSHVEGYMTAASGMGSHVDGVNASDGGHSHAFVWQGHGGETLTSAEVKVLTDGLEGEQHDQQFPVVAQKALGILGSTQRYVANGPGTFNINPAGGVNGFFIGQDSLSSIIQTAINQRLGNAETLVDEILN